MIQNLWLKFKRFILPYPMAYVVKYTLRLILWTCRVDVEGLENFIACSRNHRCVLSLWHNRLAIVPEVLKRFTSGLTFNAVISKSRDGEPLAILVNSYREGKTIRVAHDDRYGALRQVISSIKHGPDILVITPDGPRGPRYELKPGIVLAARATGAHVVPFSWTANTFWRLKTWDGFMLPKPFSTIRATFGAPVLLPAGASIEESAILLKEAMMSNGMIS